MAILSLGPVSAAIGLAPRASGRVHLRDSSISSSLPSDYVVDSTLTDTPGNISATPSAPLPLLAMAVYPGYADQILVTDGSAPGWGPAVEPGLIPTLAGFPRTPKFYVQAQTLATTSGTFLSGTRDLPEHIDVGTQARFLAKDWTGTQVLATPTSALPWSLTGTGTLVDYQYRVGKELFDRSAISLNPGDALHSNFPASSATELTASLVVAIRQPLGFPLLTVDTTTLTTAETWSTTLAGHTRSSEIGISSARSIPYFITMAMQPPTVWVYVSTTVGTTQRFSVSGLTGAINVTLKVGQIAAETPVASVDVMELNLDLYARNSTQVAALHAAYGSTYGQGA